MPGTLARQRHEASVACNGCVSLDIALIFSFKNDYSKLSPSSLSFYVSRSEETLASMWIEKANGGYFCRQPQQRDTKFAFTNFGVSYGLASCGLWPDKVDKINQLFETYRSHDEYDTKAITHVMHMNSLHPGVLLAAYQPPN